MNYENHALIDWLAFTLPVAYTEYDIGPVIADLFGLDFAEFVKSDSRQKGTFYKTHHCYYSQKLRPMIHVNTEPSADNNAYTTAFSVTGAALSEISDLNIDPVALTANILNRSGRITRYDIALDYFGDVPLLASMIELSRPDVWRDHIVTKLRFMKPIALWNESIYYGHLKNGKVICAYDKANQTGTPGPWFRCEFRTSDRPLCADIARELVSGVPVGKIVSGLLWQYLRFVPRGHRPRDKRPVVSWWEDFLSDAEGYTLTRHRDGKSGDNEKTAPTAKSFTQYLKSALALDETGQLRKIAKELIAVDEFNSTLAAAGGF